MDFPPVCPNSSPCGSASKQSNFKLKQHVQKLKQHVKDARSQAH